MKLGIKQHVRFSFQAHTIKLLAKTGTRKECGGSGLPVRHPPSWSTDIERLSGGTFAGRVTSLPGQGPRILEAKCKSLPESFVNLSGFALQDA